MDAPIAFTREEARTLVAAGALFVLIPIVGLGYLILDAERVR